MTTLGRIAIEEGAKKTSSRSTAVMQVKIMMSWIRPEEIKELRSNCDYTHTHPWVYIYGDIYI